MIASMTDREDFLAWVHGALYEAELALHNEDGKWKVAHRHGDAVTD